MHDERCTGNKRYRMSFFGKLILQVEIEGAIYYGSYTKHIYWRDAKIEDITEGTV